MEDANLQQMIEPAIHIAPNQQVEVTHIKMEASSMNKDQSKPSSSKPQVIIIPYQDENGHERGFIQEVYRYPPNSIKTVVERNSSFVSEESNLDRACRRGERKPQNKISSSQSSLASSSSVGCTKSRSSSNASATNLCSNIQNHDGLASPSANSTFRSDCSEAIANANHHHTTTFQKLDSDRLSDSSSNISTISDLSGYEDEYLAVKNFLAFGASNIVTGKKPSALSQSLNEKLYLKAKIEEQEATIKSLQSSKDDLEIQAHRFATRLQNLVREKEICQEQLDIMLGKITEKNQHEYFQLQKVKANLEGQYEALKIEHQHCLANNEQLETKLCQQRMNIEKYEKDKVHFKQTSKKMEESIRSLEEKNIKLQEDLKVATETLSEEIKNSLALREHIADKDNYLKEMESRTSSYLSEIKNCQDTINSFKKWNLEYAEREENQRLEKVRIENSLSESTKKINSLKENNEWYQLQLNKAQSLQSSLQSELAEAKNSLTRLTAERDRYKNEAESLNGEMEDSRASAVREKSSLLVQLEELEANMREREATISRLEKGDEGVYVKVSEERFRILEEDHKRVQELKIEVRDALTYSNSLKEELKHKASILKKHEEAIHSLRKDFAVMKEEDESKQLCIDSLRDKLNLTKLKLDESFEKIRSSEAEVTKLKEQKVKLEASLSLSEEEKRHVDDTLVILREDMNKLSSSFFRMKHDLLAKDKRIETLSTQNTQLVQLEQELKTKAEIQSKQIQEKERKKLMEEATDLQKTCQTLEQKNAKLSEEICQLKNSLEMIKLEKQTLTNSVNVRDEQITKMHKVVEAYKEKMVKKDEEITTKKEYISTLEEAHSDLQKKFNHLSNECELIRQERDEFRELETNNKNSISALKECVRLEKQSKDSYTRKYEETLMELKETKELINKNNKTIQDLIIVKEEFDKQNESMKLHKEEIKKLKALSEIQTKQNFEYENKIKFLNSSLEESKMALTSSEKKYVESINTKNNDIQSLHKTLSESRSEVEKLSTTLAEKEEELRISESKSNKKFVNSFRNPRKPQNTKQVSHNNNSARVLRDDKREVDSLKLKLKELSNIIASKEKELIPLRASVSEQNTLKSHNLSLQSEVEKTKQECVSLKEKYKTLNNRCTLLQEDLKRSCFDLDKKEKDCNDWKAMYENLMDAIPQRDTDSHQLSVVNQWHVLHSLNDPSSSRLALPNSRVDMPVTNESLHQNCNLEEREQFTNTMAYLQNQISLTAESLQSKDRQILELNEKLSALSVSKQLDCSPLEKLKNSPAESLLCASPEAQTSGSVLESNEHQGRICEQAQVEMQQSIEIPPNVNTENEEKWKEKQRRFESNVRFLTRKLKEHMKGRRAAEKELATATQEHRRNLEAEERRYNSLKESFLELEKRSQELQSELSSCEKAKRESELSFHNLKEELDKERKTNLELQKKNGQVEELKHNLETLRTKNNSIAAELSTKNKELNEKEETIQKTVIGQRVLEERCQSSTSHMEELKQRLADEHLKVMSKDEEITKKQEEINAKNEEIAHLTTSQSSLQCKHDHLEELLNRVRSENAEISQRMRQLTEELERLSKLLDSKSTTVEDLNAKKEILERELKMKDELVESLRIDGEALQSRLVEAEHKCESSTALLNKKLAEMREMELSLNEKVNTVHREKMSYQSQCTQLKVTLNSALEKLQANSEVQSLPSPSPLNTEILTSLMERCSKPPPSTDRLMASLTERLGCLREEVCTLQSEIKARDQLQLGDIKQDTEESRHD